MHLHGTEIRRDRDLRAGAAQEMRLKSPELETILEPTVIRVQHNDS